MNNLNLLRSMSESAIDNYIIPGMRSSLLTNGKVRLFEMNRRQNIEITPHSHRFDFACCVMQGQVEDTVWYDTLLAGAGDQFQVTELQYQGEPGNYESKVVEVSGWCGQPTTYRAGNWYDMRAEAVHSIRFSHDAVVLFLEGPERSDKTIILEPCVNGAVVPTFRVEDWMFQAVK